VFDEQLFPFSTLHPNVGGCLRSEIALLPKCLLNSNTSFGEALLHDQHLSSPISTDAMSNAAHTIEDAGENLDENSGVLASKQQYFMLSL